MVWAVPVIGCTGNDTREWRLGWLWWEIVNYKTSEFHKPHDLLATKMTAATVPGGPEARRREIERQSSSSINYWIPPPPC
jgi:hypothetical protein